MSATEKIDVKDVFRVSKTGNIIYINIAKHAKIFNLEKGDKLRIHILEKILETYE